MRVLRERRNRQQIDYWPGFVDALSTLLLSIMFLLSVFVIAQFFLSQEISGKDKALDRLTQQINELTELLALEQSSSQDQISNLQASLLSVTKEKDDLKKKEEAAGEKQKTIETLTEILNNERRLSEGSLLQIERLNQHIGSLLKQISMLENTLEISESKLKHSGKKIEDLGKRLNIALAQQVQELNRYRSDFFGRLRDILSEHKDIRIVGDRFVFQSELLFKTGSEKIDLSGKKEMKKVAHALIQLEKEIPKEINWVLRVDGHTDDKPFTHQGHYADNWELSSARAMSVVKYLIENGVSPQRLVAAGFGEFQPLEKKKTEEAQAKNRRIELKLTEK